MTSWSDVSNILLAEYNKLDGQEFGDVFAMPPMTFEAIPDIVRNADLKIRESVDSLAAEFVDTGSIPECSSEEEVFFLRQRFYAGFMLASALVIPARFSSVHLGSELSKEEKLRWLLIETWPFFGLGLWVGEIVSKINVSELREEHFRQMKSAGGVQKPCNTDSQSLFFREGDALTVGSTTG